jgi:hypothetical protein
MSGYNSVGYLNKPQIHWKRAIDDHADAQQATSTALDVLRSRV